MTIHFLSLLSHTSAPVPSGPQEAELPWFSRTADGGGEWVSIPFLGSEDRALGKLLPFFQVTDCGSPLHRLRSPLHSGPGSPAGGSFCLEPPGLRRSLDEDEPPPSPLARYRPLHNAASHEGLAATSGSPPRSAPSSDSSPSFVRRYARAEPHSEGEPGGRGAPCCRAPGTAATTGGKGGCGERWKDGGPSGSILPLQKLKASFTEALQKPDITGPKQSRETVLGL